MVVSRTLVIPTYFLVLTLSSLALLSCTGASNLEKVEAYYQGKDSSNFALISRYVGDTITIVEGDFVMPYDLSQFYEVCKWDSIFNPSYTVTKLTEKGDQVLTTVKINSLKHEYLQNSNMKCQYLVSFKNGKIRKIESLKCKDVDWNIWQKQVDTLVNWIQQYHPELNGFINDMTMNGALDYLKAIELYKSANISK